MKGKLHSNDPLEKGDLVKTIGSFSWFSVFFVMAATIFTFVVMQTASKK
jgi:hypothetical protein